MLSKKRIEITANQVRRLVLEHTIKNNGGYLSQACSSAEILATLYEEVLNITKPEKPIMPKDFTGVPCKGNKNYFSGNDFHGKVGEEFDRFFVSPAQYALVIYSALIATKRMDDRGLEHFNKDGGVVEMIGAEHSPGMEVMTGSLGQGISQASGVAFARKRKKHRGRVVLFMSDGEFQIGQTWEALQAMSYHKLDNLLVYVDVNGYQCDGKMSDVMDIEPLEDRLRAFGALVCSVDGHDIDKLIECGKLEGNGKSVFVLCKTDPTRGIDVIRKREPKFHYVRFASEEERQEYVDYYDRLEVSSWR